MAGRPGTNIHPLRGRLRLLGLPAFEVAGKFQALPAKALALVAYLALSKSNTLSRSQAAQMLWSEADAERAAGNLRQLLARLREVQEKTGLGFLTADTAAIHLDANRLAIDVVEIDAAAAALVAGANVAEALKQLCNLFHGELLEGIKDCGPAFEEWLAEARQRLSGKIVDAVSHALNGGSPQLGASERLAGATLLFECDPANEAAAKMLLDERIQRGDRAGADRIKRQHESATGAKLEGARPPIVEMRDAPSVPAKEASIGRLGSPRVAILPPINLHAGDGIANLATVLIEDVTVKLSRYRSFTVLAPYTASQIAGGGGDQLQLTPQKADYLVSTSVKPSSEGWAMTFRLTETESAAVLWVSEIAWRPELLSRIFDFLITRVVVSLVDAIERETLKVPVSGQGTTAYRLYLEGQQCLKSLELPELRRARKWFRDSAGEAKGYAAPLVGLSHSLFMEWMVRGMKDPALLLESANVAGEALALDPFDWRALRERALCSLYRRRHDESLENFEKAILLAPNDADMLADYADALAFAGEPDKGLTTLRKAMELNPIVPGYYSWILGSILFQQQRYGEALEALEPVRNNDATARIMAACSARAGLFEQARGYAEKVREVFPGLKADDVRLISPNRRAEDMEHLVGGLKLAGID